MVIKTFNVDEEVYKEFSAHCKKNGISMSKKIENFLRDEISRIKGKPPAAIKKTAEKNAASSSLHHSFSKYC